jgi:exodeoxyribonuclease VII large subunit
METTSAVTPLALVNLFANAMPIAFTEKLYRLKGIYLQGKGSLYGGFYYDGLKDEAADASITLVVPALIRSGMDSQQLVEVTGYLQRKVQITGARIELQFVVTELVSNEVKGISEEQVQAFDILQQKANSGYRDVDGFIKAAILEDRSIRFTIIVGKTAIIDSDINHQLGDATGFYDIEYRRITLTNENELVEALQESDTDVLVVARGGGDRMEVFDRSSVAEAALEVQPLLVTAIGHQQDNPLLQKVADKHFITPTAFGQYLSDMYNRTIEEKSRSKGRAVEEATRHLKEIYERQLQNEREAARLAKEALTSQKELHVQELAMIKESVKETVVIKRGMNKWVVLLIIILSLVAGILFTMLFLNKWVG